MLDPSQFHLSETKRGSGIHAGWVFCVKHPAARNSIYDAQSQAEGRAFIAGYAKAVRDAAK